MPPSDSTFAEFAGEQRLLSPLKVFLVGCGILKASTRTGSAGFCGTDKVRAGKDLPKARRSATLSNERAHLEPQAFRGPAVLHTVKLIVSKGGVLSEHFVPVVHGL